MFCFTYNSRIPVPCSNSCAAERLWELVVLWIILQNLVSLSILPTLERFQVIVSSLKIKMQGLVVKSISCSSKGPELIPSTYMAALWFADRCTCNTRVHKINTSLARQ